MLDILSSFELKTSPRLAARLAGRTGIDFADSVSRIVNAVRTRGDTAVLEFTAQFDGGSFSANALRVDPRSIETAAIPPQATVAMQRAIKRIEAFHRQERGNDWWTVSQDGALLGQRMQPLDSVGVYIPGGKAPYASSLLMNVIPARIAGVRRIVAVTPPGTDGVIDPSILVSARLCGIDEMYRIGGAQAIAALAFGTASIPKVAKIVGPGNAYVTEAKRLVYGDVGIDTLAGPSEIAILADQTADPRLVAADLIAQAEHDDDALVLLATTQPALVGATIREIKKQLENLDRAATIQAALASSIALVAETLEQAVDCINDFAPEHLQLFVADPLGLVAKIGSAGVILCGAYSPAAICDYGIGPNHILPTGGAGRFASALGVNDFLRRVSVISASREAFASVAPDAIALAELEGLTGHAAALQLRLEVS
jgi:histidinol dehydrogenase